MTVETCTRHSERHLDDPAGMAFDRYYEAPLLISAWIVHELLERECFWYALPMQLKLPEADAILAGASLLSSGKGHCKSRWNLVRPMPPVLEKSKAFPSYQYRLPDDALKTPRQLIFPCGHKQVCGLMPSCSRLSPSVGLSIFQYPPICS
jgi:hypothetical protein